MLGLDEGVHAARARRRDRHADLAPEALGKALGQLLPGVAAVGRLPQARARAARDELPRAAHDLPEPGVEDPRVRRVHRQVRGAGLLVDVEDLLPRLAAVLRAEDPALGVGAPDVALRRDVDEVRIRRMDADARDLAGVAQPDVLPGPAAVGRLVDAVAVRDVAADGLLSGADVDHVRIGLRDGDRADRARLEVLVGDDLPVGAAVGRLPDAAAGRAEVERVRIAPNAGDRRHAPAAEGPDQPELEALEAVGKALLGSGRGAGGGGAGRRRDRGQRSDDQDERAEEGPEKAQKAHGAPFARRIRAVG